MAVLIFLSTPQRALPNQAKSAKTTPHVLIVHCPEDGVDIRLPDYPAREKVARVADVDLEAAFPTENAGATFWFVRGGTEIFSFTAKDVDSPNLWMAVYHDPPLDGNQRAARIAITYSDGGAIGGFHVRIFLIDDAGVRDVSKSIDRAVREFKARHYCKERGNNVAALKWVRGDLLIWTEVYLTGDCAPDSGHLEGYLVSIPQGKIMQHLTLNQLRRYPGVCLQNDAGN
jgi:hypothetical protein